MNWRYCLFPELKAVPEARRERLWQLANAEPFRPSEWIVILVAIAVAALAVQTLKFKARLGAGLPAFAADFVVAGAVLLVIAGPVYWRRMKRGLGAALRQSQEE